MDPVNEAPDNLPHSRAYLMAAALLCFHFSVGDLLRWIGGVYTHNHIDLEPIHNAVSEVRNLPYAPTDPIVYYGRAMHILEHGVLVRATYFCTQFDVHDQNTYDNQTSIGK